MDLVRLGERIRRERERAGLGQRGLAEAAGLSQPTLHRIEAGTRAQVTLAEVDRVAQALDVPLRLLTTGSPVRERVRIAARINTLVEADREEALRLVVEVLELDARLDGADGGAAIQRQRDIRVPQPDAGLSPELQGRELAAAVRGTLGLGSAPITDVEELIEQLTGVDTAVLDLPRTLDGFAATDPVRHTTLIAVRACDVPERQRFTFSHELGHLLLADGSDVHEPGSGRTPEERRCDAFARHLLAPEEGIRTWLGTRQDAPAGEGSRSFDERTTALLARHFRVSFLVMLIQLQQMRLLSAARKEELRGPTGVELSQRYGWWPVYEQEVDAARTMRSPRRVLERAMAAYRDNRIGVGVLARLENRSVHEAEEALTEAGITPEPPAVKRADLARLAARRTPGHGAR